MATQATVVGSGPNGLSAAVALARAGYDVRVLEAADTIGGGVRTADLTLPGFRHDVCSAVHPAALSSPFFHAFGLRERLDWIVPEISFAQPLDGGRAAIAWRDLERTADALGRDARAWRAVVRPLSTHLEGLVDFTGNQLLRVPQHPITTVRFGLRALQLGSSLGRGTFATEEANALISGVLAHANTPLPSLGAASSGLFLVAHAHTGHGWTYPRGGAQTIADALVADLREHGGEVQTGHEVTSLADLDWGDPDAGDLLLLDTSPRLLLSHPDLPPSYARAVRRYRYGRAAAKVDFALDGPIPWAHPDVARSPTVHLGGTRAEVEASENAVARGWVTDRPYVLAVQPSILDPTRAPEGKQVLWAYIHVPADSTLDATELVTRQVERFAPGFRERVLASHAMTAAEREAYNPADIGGDILGGAFSFVQAFRRPVVSPTPWRTPLRGVYLASASTPPGPGVTGMPGWYAARQALRDTADVRVERRISSGRDVMDGFGAVDFEFARQVLQRGIAALYVVAFLSTLNQFRPLLGENGLLPAPDVLSWARRSKGGSRLLGPTLFRYVRYTDRRLVMLCTVGMVIGAALVSGIPQWGPPWVPMLCFLALWLGYMSIVSLGQTFYGFGWEMLLLESGFLAAFLGSDGQPPATVVIVLFWWLVFRLEFGAGMIKIRGGREWRDLTALMYHHETQPMPGPLSRQAHLLPRWFHRLEVLGNHFAQLVVPWFLFAPLLGLWVPGPIPAIIGAVAAAIVIGTQLWLVLTGNFAWLNWATIVLAASAIGIPGIGDPSRAAVDDPPWVIDGLPLPWLIVTAALGILYAVVSWRPLRNLFARRQLMNAAFNRWQLGNAYGAFGTVTKERIEIVVEGTADQDPDAGTWQEYGFKGKPGDLHRIPRQYAPYHLRLDWLMWFLPLGRSLDDWFTVLLLKLLEADPAILRLLASDPFDGERPVWVRAVSYRYRFTTRAQFRQDHARWTRDRRRLVLGPLRLRG